MSASKHRRGIIAAGALPLAFPTISPGELFLSPTAMLFRVGRVVGLRDHDHAEPLHREDRHPRAS